MRQGKTIAYDYAFNYFGGDKYNGVIVQGASITLAIRCYKNGQEVKFDESLQTLPCVAAQNTDIKHGLCEVFDVSIDRNSLFRVSRNLIIDNLFRQKYGYDKIEYDVVEYSLDVFKGPVKDTFPELGDILPEDMQDSPVCQSVKVSEDVFRQFISSHIEDFDIPDNKKAQCPCYCLI